MEGLIVKRAQEYRVDNPGLGCAKLYLMLKQLFDSTGVMPGRDAVIELLRRNGLMVHRKQRRHHQTTDSKHNYRRYPNLIKGIKLNRPNQLWVCDITYIETIEGVFYLSLVTDAYSHKIVGWCLARSLEAKNSLAALRMALSTLAKGEGSNLIHHSDRGSQYCSYAYVAELQGYGVRISMTQNGDPLENAIAERVNGILKTEWIYRTKIASWDECKSLITRIIDFYNTQRPHMSIGMQVPEFVHTQIGEQRRCWKNQYQKE